MVFMRFLLACLLLPLVLVAADNKNQAEEAANLANQGRYEEAAQKFQEAISLDSKNASLYLGLGLVYQSLQRYAQAVASLEKAVELNKSLAEAYYSLALLYEVHSVSSEGEAPQKLKKQHLLKAKVAWEKFLKLADDHKKTVIAKKHLAQIQEELESL